MIMPMIGKSKTKRVNLPSRTWKTKNTRAKNENIVRTIPITFKLLAGAFFEPKGISLSSGSAAGVRATLGSLGWAGSVGKGTSAGSGGVGTAGDGTRAGAGGVGVGRLSSGFGAITCPHQGHSIVPGVKSAVHAGHWTVFSSVIIHSFACRGSFREPLQAIKQTHIHRIIGYIRL